TSTSVAFSPGYAPVGAVVFHVRNATTKPRSFTIAGHRTPDIAAGGTGSVVVTLSSRRGYAYSVAPGSAGLQGYFNAVEPCMNPESTTIRVTLTSSSIQLSEPSLRCGTVTFDVTNTDTTPHDLSFDMSLLGAAGRVVLGPKLDYTQKLTEIRSFAFRGTVYY